MRKAGELLLRSLATALALLVVGQAPAQPDLEVLVCEDDAEIVERIDERTLLVPISHVLFKDSVIQDIGPIPTGILVGASETTDLHDYFPGAIDDVRMYDATLTPSQITAIFK